jgi:hypothetical protein
LQAATSDTAAAAIARDVVRKLGVGKKIRLRTVTDEEVRGRITSIGADAFTVDVGLPRVISYADVSTIKRQGLPWVVKGPIIGGIVLGAMIAGMGICYASGSCVS